ncbi:cytochrome c biogenesis protein DipZ [Acidipropionibacterium timonense]|uniref:cytochrome c biogenesis protein DipZ n=1 Tax=Acidipropionibacterium timonense TaxID=2161818 RepID=UPI0010309599|nr:redoxin domain-containing protein [Acidipropionibacterium timonense]
MLLTALLSLVAGVLTVLAPCVLPFLPIIVGGSLGAGGGRRRPWLIAGSLVVSLVAFSLLLKASTLLVHVDPRVWSIASGVIVVLLGLSMLFPSAWSRVATWTGLDRRSHALLDASGRARNDTARALLTGAALGPVFSSCSPTYAWVIATVLPADRVAGMVYLGLYCVGLAAALLAVSLLGRHLVDRIRWLADPRGWFQRAIAVCFIIVGLLVATGADRRFQAWTADHAPGITTSLERKALNSDSAAEPTHHTAPELTGITGWINSAPLTMSSLRGKVVLVDFWTYSCVNCVRTQPYLNSWYKAYHDQGLEIIGVHAPEFSFEKVPDNVRKAVKDAGIAYPVALDNNFRTWNAYHNQYWPAKYLIDRDGVIRYTHFGEGEYEQTEERIRELLGHPSGHASAVASAGTTQGDDAPTSPETYLGSARAMGYVGTPELSGTRTFTTAGRLSPDTWALSGTWQIGPESIIAKADGARIEYDFRGHDMFLVLAGRPGQKVRVSTTDGTAPGGADVKDGVITLDGDRMYRIAHLSRATAGTQVILTVDAGVSAHAFTFG